MTDRLYRWLKKHPSLLAISALMRGRPVITLDYPVEPRARWGYGQPPHPELAKLIEDGRNCYQAELQKLLTASQNLSHIPESLWHNAFMPGLDIATLYCFISTRHPQRYVEVGSGISTKVVAEAVKSASPTTKITSIDPQPRADINSLCDEVIRQPLEEIDVDLPAMLTAGDVLFIDNSHQSFQNSDVTVFFLEILPRLKPGVLIGIHDIFLPDDYPESYTANYYSEQYLLAVYLLGGSRGIRIILPNWFVSQDDALAPVAAPLTAAAARLSADVHGGIFWFETVLPSQL